jgi:hypothetical protein
VANDVNVQKTEEARYDDFASFVNLLNFVALLKARIDELRREWNVQKLPGEDGE